MNIWILLKVVEMEWKNTTIVVFIIVTFMIGNMFGLKKSRVDNVFENKIKGTKPVKRSTHVSIH